MLFLTLTSALLSTCPRYNAPSVRTTLVMPGHIHTPMFSRMAWPKSRIWKFFVPSLQPITVAKAVIRAIDNQHSETIYLPFYANFAFALRAMPSFARDFCQWVCVWCSAVWQEAHRMSDRSPALMMR
jgi:short-subunit dehydrogenase